MPYEYRIQVNSTNYKCLKKRRPGMYLDLRRMKIEREIYEVPNEEPCKVCGLAIVSED
jgi:hypothetical protein